MDDPWGSSPWADEEDSQSIPNEVLGDFVRPTNSRTISESPWKDDDDFGDWAALPGQDHEKPQDVADAQQWGEDNNDEVARTSREEPIHSDVSWQQRQSGRIDQESDAVQDSERSRSPDAWGADLKDAMDSETNEGITLQRATAVPHDEVMSHDATIRAGDLHRSDDAGQSPKDPVFENIEASSDEAFRAMNSTPNLTINDSDAPTATSSTSPSESSHGADDQPESPRTSVEEEPKRPPLERKGSSKVQQLVEKFESLGASGDAAKIDSADAKANSMDDDFGDFEESNLKASDGSHPQSINELPPMTGIELAPVGAASEEAAATAVPQPAEGVMSKVIFDVDKSMYDRLFPSTHTSVEIAAPILDKDIPDSPVSRDFSLEQRKLWYRISRYGTMQKHNSGNDENYIHTTWARSTVREDTLKIVKRWMEEDRIGRGVVLGGSNRLGSLFGWRDTSGLPNRSTKDTTAESVSVVSKMSILPPPSDVVQHASASVGTEQRATKLAPAAAIPAITPQFSWSSAKPLEPRSLSSVIPSSGSQLQPSATSHAQTLAVANDDQMPRSATPKLAADYPRQPNSSNSGVELSMQVPKTSIAQGPSEASDKVHSSTSFSNAFVSAFSSAETVSPYDFGGLDGLTTFSAAPSEQVFAHNKSQAVDGLPKEPVASISSSKPLAVESLPKPSGDAPRSLVVRTATLPMMDEEDDWGEMVSSPALPPPVERPRTPSPARRPQSMLNTISTNDLDAAFGPARGHRQTLSMSEEIATPGKAESILGSPALHSPIKRTPRSSVSSVRSANLTSVDLFTLDTPAPPPTGMSSSSTRPRRSSRLSMGAINVDGMSSAPTHLPTILSPSALDTPTVGTHSRKQSLLRNIHDPLSSKEDIDHDRIVKKIVQGLPDLSYMFR